jgi:general secretion pathway protein D
MPFFNRLIAVIVSAALVAPLSPLQASTRKGDKFLASGRIHEAKKEWDAALADYEQALSEDPADVVYQAAVDRARFQTGQYHIDQGLKIRAQGRLGDALIEFQKAYQIDPGSMIATQEIQETRAMIERERKRIEQTGKEAPPEVRALTPTETQQKAQDDKLNRILPVPELRPLRPGLIDLKMSNRAKVLFETLGKIAGINVVWDPDYQTPPGDKTITIDFEHLTLEQALDNLAVLTKSFWKALSPNTIFVTNDTPNKRHDYEEQVLQTFYLQNISTQQEMQEVVNAVRTVPELTRVFQDTSQYAIIVRGEADRVALAAKIIRDLDKPKSEVLVDILVIEASSTFSKQITAAIASTGLNVPVAFTPRASIQVQTNTSSSTSNNNQNGVNNFNQSTNSTATATGSTPISIPLSQLGHLSSADFSTTLPGALLQAAMSDAKTKVLQAPEMRLVDGVKGTLNIGQKQPTATGSFQPGVGGVGINPLVNTQFTYLDVGVNIEATAWVHGDSDVSMHLKLDISNVSGQVNLGGIEQPIIGQRKVEHEFRMKEGEVGIVGGLLTQQDDKTVTGIPGLASLPLLGHLFKGYSMDHNRDDIMIVLIPHIIRKRDISAENLAPIAVGNQQTVKLTYAPAEEQPAPQTPAPAPGSNAPGAGAPPAAAPSSGAPPATAPPATAPPSAGQTSSLRFAPTPVETTQGGTFTVSLMLDNASGVSSAPVQIQFDPKALKLNDVTQGDLLGKDGAQVFFTKNVQNDAGTASVELNRPPGSAGVNGSGTLVTLSFTAVGKGTSQITAPNVTVKNAAGQTIATGTPQLSVTVK